MAIFNFQSMKNRRTFSSAACFLVTSRSTNMIRLSPKRSCAMMTGWISCGLLTRTAKKLSSVTAITICRQTDKRIGLTQVNLVPICQITRRSSASKSEASNRASSLPKFTFHAQIFPTFWRRRQNYCARTAQSSSTVQSD